MKITKSDLQKIIKAEVKRHVTGNKSFKVKANSEQKVTEELTRITNHYNNIGKVLELSKKTHEEFFKDFLAIVDPDLIKRVSGTPFMNDRAGPGQILIDCTRNIEKDLELSAQIEKLLQKHYKSKGVDSGTIRMDYIFIPYFVGDLY
jgi:hypothetical protein